MDIDWKIIIIPFFVMIFAGYIFYKLSGAVLFGILVMGVYLKDFKRFSYKEKIVIILLAVVLVLIIIFWLSQIP